MSHYLALSCFIVPAASALNSGNRLLRSYDLVAARPMNQMAFDQACQASEVDIISLDFSQKLPFRLKLAMVQAAVKRGVHFQISYSHIITGGHARRQILSEAKGENDVAVKVLNLHEEGAVRSFITECQLLRNVHHRNLLKIVTLCSILDSKGNEFKDVVLGYMPNGSLERWLHPEVEDKFLKR